MGNSREALLRKGGTALRRFVEWSARSRIAATLLAVGALAHAGVARGQEATLVMDANSGEVLYAYHEDLQLFPASLTKMMTLYMVFDALDEHRLAPDEMLNVSARAAAQPPSRLGLAEGSSISADDAILALITKSANDAAVVLAEAVADAESDFARAMTRKAHELGMNDTVFRNASGLHEDGQVTTARDIARLAVALMRDHPDYYKQFATRTFSWHGRRYTNHNPLLTAYQGADGIKTGYIKESGYNLVGSAERDGQRVVAVVLGSKTPGNRDWAVTTLLDYGFEQIAAVHTVQKSRNLRFIGNPPQEKALTIAIATVSRPASDAHRGMSGGSPGEHDDWAVQVGAFPSTPPAAEAARRAREEIPEILGDTELSLPAVDSGGSRFYRARLVGLTEVEARTACRRLAMHGIPCIAIGDDGRFRTSLVE